MNHRLFYFLAGSLGILSAQPVDVILTLETSPGTEQTIGLIRPRVFQQGDRAAVITFTNRAAQVLQPLTNDREALASALQRAGIRVGVGIGGVQINSNWTADIVGAIKQSCEELQRSEFSERKRAVVVLFGSEDPALRTNLETLKAALGAANARLYAVLVDRSAGERGTPPGRQVRVVQPFPASTAQLMAELAKDSGGRIFRGGWELKDILKELR
jgi:hypothetical protein